MEEKKKSFLKRTMRSLIPALAGLALWEIDDNGIVGPDIADILVLALMQRYLTRVWTAAAGIKIG